MPRIGMCCSGGGVRAQVATLGLLSGAEKIGLLNAVSDIASLSGSTWAIIQWILHKMSPNDYSEIVQKQLQMDFWDVKALNIESTKLMLDKMRSHIIDMVPTLHKYKLSFTELWGHLIARRLLYDLEASGTKQLTFADIRKILNKKSVYPFPIFATLIAETNPNYQGLEVTPLTAYSSYLNAGIPTEFLGNTFADGTCQKNLPEKPLSFYMGVFGSAYTASPADALIPLLLDFSDMLEVEDTFIQHIQSKLAIFLKKIHAFDVRTFDAKVPNFTYKMPLNEMSANQDIHLLDYGVYFNLPIFPFFREERRPDILIICDASSDASDCDFTQLKNAQIFAKKQNARFPSLTKFKNIAQNLKIFYEDDPTIPLVIYLANQTKAFTLDMNYETKQQFDSIYQSMIETIASPENKHAIIEAIKFKTSQINQQLVPNSFNELPNGKNKKYSCTIL